MLALLGLGDTLKRVMIESRTCRSSPIIKKVGISLRL